MTRQSPPVSPGTLDFPGVLQKLRASWAESVLTGDISLPPKIPLQYQTDPFVEVFSFLLAKQTASFTPSAPALLSMGALCQLSLLWSIAGADGRSLGQKLLPFCDLPSLWSSESTYDEQEAKISIALLLAAFGKKIVLPENVDPYFAALHQLLPSWTGEKIDLATMGTGMMHPLIGALPMPMPLGAFRGGAVEVTAFGPQMHSLNDAKLFGALAIDQTWSAVFAKREIWCKMEADASRIGARFFGVGAQDKLYFVFYMRAEDAKVGEEMYAPRSLKRYSGMSNKVVFQRKGTCLSIESQGPTSMELIPLAGEGCFWNSDFLLAFEISPHDGKAVYTFEVVCV